MSSLPERKGMWRAHFSERLPQLSTLDYNVERLGMNRRGGRGVVAGLPSCYKFPHLSSSQGEGVATLDVDGLPILLFLPRAFPISLPIRRRILLSMFPKFTEMTQWPLWLICVSPPFLVFSVWKRLALENCWIPNLQNRRCPKYPNSSTFPKISSFLGGVD